MNELENKLLTEVYSKYYIGEHGECRYFDECKKRLKKRKIKHQCDRVRIGADYGNKNYPQVLFVGIEGFCDCNNEYNVVDSFSEPSKNANNPHYNGLLYVMQYLLSAYNKCPKPTKVKANDNDKYNLTDKFALTNLYKCAFVPKDKPNETSGLSHTKGMKQHCKEILLEEIGLLQPDVIIVQTSQWPNGLFDKMKEKYSFDKPEVYFGENDETSVYKGTLNGKQILLLCTYHGAYQMYKTSSYLLQQLNPTLDKTIELLRN